jgi:hypothetical protein
VGELFSEYSAALVPLFAGRAREMILSLFRGLSQGFRFNF